MVTLRGPLGIYLVGWFDKLKWDPKDHRRRQTHDLTLQDAQVRLDQEAAVIPQGYAPKIACDHCVIVAAAARPVLARASENSGPVLSPCN